MQSFNVDENKNSAQVPSGAGFENFYKKDPDFYHQFKDSLNAPCGATYSEFAKKCPELSNKFNASFVKEMMSQLKRLSKRIEQNMKERSRNNK